MSAAIYRVGHWLIDCGSLKVKRDDECFHVAAKPMQVLAMLVRAEGQTVTREQLIATIWQGNEFVGPKAVSNAIWTLRRIFTDDVIAIQTVPKQGYRLTAMQSPERLQRAPSSRQSLLRRMLRPALLAGLMGLSAMAIAVFLRPQSVPPALITQSSAIDLPRPAAFNPALSPDGSRLAYSAREQDQMPDIFIHDLSQSDPPVQLTATPQPERRPQWSADGRSLAFLRFHTRQHCDVVIASLDRAEETIVDQCHPRAPLALAWSRSSHRLAYLREVDGQTVLWVRDGDSGEVDLRRRLTERAELSAGLSWGPDGNELAITTRPADSGSQVAILDVNTDRLQIVYRSDGVISQHSWYDRDHLLIDLSLDNQQWLWTLERQHSTLRPLLTAAGSAMQPDYHAQTQRLAFHQQLLHDTPQAYRLGSTMPAAVLDSGMSSTQAAPCGVDSVVFTSSHQGQRQIWLSRIDGSAAQWLTAGRMQAHSPVCHHSGRWLAFIGQCAEGSSAQLCVHDRDKGETVALTQRQSLTGIAQWDGDTLLLPAQREQQHLVLRLGLDGLIIAEYVIPHAAHLARNHPQRDALLFSSPQSGDIWMLDLASGQSTPLDIGRSTTEWGLWDVTTEGIVYLHNRMRQFYLWRYEWSGKRQRLAELPALRPLDHGRLVWDPQQQWLWLDHIARVDIQIRLASLAADQ
ncbi:MAG: hypothetical protein Tsb002_19010 [Wenzhouxiangellaceae bacterium]